MKRRLCPLASLPFILVAIQKILVTPLMVGVTAYVLCSAEPKTWLLSYKIPDQLRLRESPFQTTLLGTELKGLLAKVSYALSAVFSQNVPGGWRMFKAPLG